MKKLISTLLIAVMIVCCFANIAVASAEGVAAISGNYVATEAGTQVTVSFTASNLEYVSYWFELNYDSTYLEIVEISRGAATAGSFQSNIGTRRIAAATDANATANGTLFTVTFNVTDAAKVGEEYYVGLNVLEIRKQGGESVSPAVTSGTVEIVCDHNYVGEVTTPATCSAEGVMTYTCEHCGDSYTEAIAKIAHTAAEGWKYDDDNHWHICSECGEVFDVAAHVWEKVVDVDATATEDGHGHYECDCGCVGETYTIPATGEDLDDVPSTGDITAQVTFGVVATLVLLIGATVLVIKRKRFN